MHIWVGQMTECAAGRYRGAVNSDLSIVSLESTNECADCPFGRYRTIARGRSADDCVKCPIGKYANITGSISVTDCQRCPAGMTAEEPGSLFYLLNSFNHLRIYSLAQVCVYVNVLQKLKMQMVLAIS